MKTSQIFKLFIASILILFTSEISFGQPATVTINQDSQIPKLLTLKKQLEKENKLSDGFTIQIYNGDLSKANYNMSRVRGSFSAWPVSLEYETPNYKVWVGDFTTRLEAERALLEIKKKFSSAFILQPAKGKN
ncbi:SPOR domain-containing protein [Rasiella rasia]|uniref:SPOR domain-containing protein n=1 Tax=Rasiella rasia TaxID=2744027 RepID=A0A6G6GNJ9_9FLAO|nr:SPOR domain-containing protein [Rasiella rasia]QIE60129.1 SPOR domain-containing protein [Rasiella rasia]